MALSVDESAIIRELEGPRATQSTRDAEWNSRYDGSWEVKQIGLATPESLRWLETPVSWGRRVVDVLESRCKLRSFYLPGQTDSDEWLNDLWQNGNVDSEASLVHRDALIFGRAFVSVGTGEGGIPDIRAESPLHMRVIVDPRQKRITAALKTVPGVSGVVQYAALYLPDQTVWLERKNSGTWDEVDRDVHRLGQVPVVMFLNRRRAGDWSGESEMSDVAGLSDVAVRTLIDMQVAMEAHATPAKYAIGVSKGDFVDKDGKPLAVWDAYFSSIMMTSNKEAKFGNFQQTDLSNFHQTMAMLAKQAATATGFPLRFFGDSTSNPPAGEAIRADESGIVVAAQSKMLEWGSQWGWVAALARRFALGEQAAAERIAVRWFDAATPTYASRADAITKLAGGTPVLSQHGAWEEMGWSPDRIAREEAYFRAEANDPVITQVLKQVSSGSAGVGA